MVLAQKMIAHFSLFLWDILGKFTNIPTNVRFLMKMFSDGDVAVPAWEWRGQNNWSLIAPQEVFNVIR
jgi:hypothetical protein